jgi:hypothetical protein
MHELNSDAAGIDATGCIGRIAGNVQFGMRERGKMPERIEIGLKVTPASERVHHAFLLFAVNAHQ